MKRIFFLILIFYISLSYAQNITPVYLAPQPQKETNPKTKQDQQIQPKIRKQTEKKPKKINNQTKRNKKTFVKGEIANIGSKYIVSPYNSVGAGIGLRKIGLTYYLSIAPEISLNFEKLNFIMSIYVPLNIELINTEFSGEPKSDFTLRKKDWDEWQDYFKVIRYFQIGGTEDHFFFSFGSNFAYSLGHGTIMQRYIPNFDSSKTVLASKLNAYGDYGGFESVIGDVTAGNIFGGLVFIKPLSLFFNDYHSKSLSFGYSFVADRNAPKLLKYATYTDMPNPNTDSSAWNQWNENAKNNGIKNRERRIFADENGRPVVLQDQFLYVQGVDTEFKVFKNQYSDIKIFVDYSWFNNNTKQGGGTLGWLGRFNLDNAKHHLFRIQSQISLYDDAYLPSFFNTFYSIERFEMISNIYGEKHFTPDGRSKYWHILNHKENKELNFSYYSEFTYSYKKHLAISFGLEKLTESYSIFGHIELPDLWIFKGMISYYQQGISSLDDMFNTTSISSVLRSAIRIEILPVLFINAYAGKEWSFWPPEKLRKNDSLQGHYISSWDANVELEIGYEWE